MRHRCFVSTLLSFFLLYQLGYRPATALPANGTGVHELLPKFGLPRGLLPQAVKSFSFSETDGRFLVLLEQPCYVEFEYLVYYDVNITGTLRYGSITDLKGIQVRKFFIWLDIDEIRVDLPPSDCIYFQVGIITKRLDVAQFANPRSCREGGCTWRDSVSFEFGLRL
ncbi:Uncharacterized protein EJ110_NYTH35587 [Nymphaea thermarum]|nr:Uncharacterized protein EJ110_NYTH35587 [Nymphaea thermarum]